MTMPSQPPARRTGLIVAIIVGTVVLVALFCGIGAAMMPDGDSKPSGLSGRTIDNERAETPDPIVVPTERPALQAKDFEPSIKITDKDCIDLQTMPDSCSFQYEVKLAIADPAAYKRARDSYSVTYSVRGLKGGEQVGTIEIDGEGIYSAFPGFGEGTPKTKLTVKITDVERRP
jgi:hypothetical protein